MINNTIINEITCQQLKQWLDLPTLFLLDVRENEEVEKCMIPNATHIPMNLIPLYLDQIPDLTKIVIYCHHGVRSMQVAQYLIDNGFDEDAIYNLKGGIDEWAQTVDHEMVCY